MVEEFDTSWFDLKNYEKLNELDLSGWYRQIALRGGLLTGSYTKELIADVIAFIKEDPINEHWDHDVTEWRQTYLKYPFNTFSVYSLQAKYCWFVSQHEYLEDVWESCAQVCDGLATDLQTELIDTPIDILEEERGEWGGIAHAAIDLTASDEQIMTDFKQWLSKFRAVIDFSPANKKYFSDKNLADWVQWRLLPYFDLMIVANAEGCVLTQAKAARLIFNDEYDIDIVDRLRRTTKPKTEWLFAGRTIEAISIQIHASA
jgi:hypothetical protein